MRSPAPADQLIGKTVHICFIRAVLPPGGFYEIDEGAHCGRNLPAARIVEKESGVIGAPLVKNPLQTPIGYMGLHLLFKKIGKACTIRSRANHHVLIAKR